jgi:hypothetical protein
MFFIRWILGFFFGPPAPAPQVQGYGFAWAPNVAINNIQYITVTDQSPAGLYVLVTPANISNPTTFFDDPGATLGLLYPLAGNPSAAFTQAMQGVDDGQGAPVTGNNNLMVRLEGFLHYAYYCLNYIAATPAGLTLLNGLRNGARTTFVMPSHMYNQTAGMSKCFVAQMIIDNNMNISQNQRAQLIQVLEQTSGAQGLNAFQWLANQINQMPLYSMFETSPNYPPAFLNNNAAAVNAGDLQQWFNTGSNCNLVLNLTAAPPIQNVPLLNFVKNAVIMLLYTNSPVGGGGGSTVNFDIRDWSQNTIGMDQTVNTMADRPPAIGLAHELIHAYHNMRGDQPGTDFGGFSTTVFELLCVGLGPFNAYQVTENAIRGAWPPPNVWPPAGDPLNNRAAAQRLVYIAPGGGQTPADMRLNNPADQNSGIAGPI